MDYALAKLKNNDYITVQELPFLSLESRMVPLKDSKVNIIQHPGNSVEPKYALTANSIIDKWGHYLYYTADTDKGSSGSPVLNQDWKVVALHHAGSKIGFEYKDTDGTIKKETGLNINGKYHSANRGILIGDILKDLKNKIHADQHHNFPFLS